MPEETLKQVVDRVKASKTAIGNAIVAKGGTVGANDGLEEYPADIATINTNTTSINITENGTYYAGEETTVTTSSLPITIYDSVGLPITHVTIEGNTVQSGTPTPDSPITPQGCGERTGNLWNEDYTGISSSIKYVPVYVGNGSFTLSTSCPIIEGAAALFFLAGNVQSGASTASNGVYKNRPITVTSISGYVTIAYRCISYQSGIADPRNEQTMFNIGSTALPYEPYGYKIPISSANTATPVYLGEVQTTRKIKKYEFTGQETISQGSEKYYTSLPAPGVPYSNMYCTHNVYGACSVNNNGGYIWLKISSWSDYATAEDLKAFFQQEYAAGTPVTVWYVLATEETAVVNEPIRKIGDYADELSINTSISLSQTQNIIDINTTLKPSSSSFTYRQKNEYIGYNEINVNVEPTSVSPKDVNFYDYDGTRVYSYTADEFAELSEMPANPSHTGLTAQGWNWSLSDAKEYVADYGELEIGQLYVTSDGKTRLYITLVDNYLSPVLQLNLSANTELDIDWGDGGSHSVFATTTQDYVSQRHIYPSNGNYVIVITVVSGSFDFRMVGTTTKPVLSNGLATTNNTNRIYLASLKKVELGSAVNIGQSGFVSCTNLESITIPSGLANIGTYGFQECANLKCLVLPDNVMLANVALRYCYSLQHIILPKTMNTILGDTFVQDVSIRNLNFSLITSFGSYSYQRCCALSNITFSKTLSSIGALAFSYNFGLETLKFTSDTPPTINNISAWTDISSDCSVLVPLGKLDDYLNTTNMPDDSVYMYLCYAKYASGAELPVTSTDGYSLTWYATKDDARAGTNPITVGNGKEVYAVGAVGA